MEFLGFFLITFVVTVVVVWVDVKTSPFDVGTPITPFTVFTSFVVVVAASIVWGESLNAFSRIENNRSLVTVLEESLSKYDTEFSDLAKQGSVTALMNADSPVKAVVEAKSKIMDKITKAKTSIVEDYTTLSSRNNGIFWFLISDTELEKAKRAVENAVKNN